MDKRQKLTAFDIVNTWSTEQLTALFKDYGEERFAKRISNGIQVTRNGKSIATTGELKAVIEKAIPTWKKRESVTRVFQALRIAVNRELAVLPAALTDAIELLKPGGRIVVLDYHSLEDRIVKQTFNAAKKAGILAVLTRKPLIAGADEVKNNPRAASAKLRSAEKL
jgi:16S rRNA (cytosine1402-N4)-methyltransferase